MFSVAIEGFRANLFKAMIYSRFSSFCTERATKKESRKRLLCAMLIDVLAKIFGHSNTNMTRHYAKFSETVIGREMEAFGQKLASVNS